MAVTSGAIFHNPIFRFHDGVIGNKLLILLNTPTHDQAFLFVTTTSKKHDKPDTHGCYKHLSQGIFFIPFGGCSFFDRDTWLLLSQRYEIWPEDKHFKNDWRHIGQLNSKLMDNVLKCLFKYHSDDISLSHEEWIRPKIESLKNQLADHFNKNR